MKWETVTTAVVLLDELREYRKAKMAKPDKMTESHKNQWIEDTIAFRAGYKDLFGIQEDPDINELEKLWSSWNNSQRFSAWNSMRAHRVIQELTL